MKYKRLFTYVAVYYDHERKGPRMSMYIEANEETFRAKFKDDNRNVDFELLAVVKLLKSVSLKSEESALTGESVPSEKDAEAEVAENAGVGDRSNMVFSGCSVTYGTATAVVTATGMNTEIGKIAGLLEGEEEGQTPLQQKLAQLGKYLGIVALAACAIIFVVGLMNGIDVLEIFMTAVSLAVSAIPEGLPAIVTIVLAIGVQRMVKKNALIRRLPAVETLGSASVICSDKTGTLTQNRMTLVKAYVDGEPASEAISTSNSGEVMITGDHVVTASAIAKELGILEKGDKAITGAELDAMTEEQLDKEVEGISVYARVSPENKIRIVKAWQRKDQVVSMTGDGVNDAPALKAADIGCAMGITGTDVAKGAADMTLTDDNFATIVDAVREGRGIYANIKKVVGFLLGTNIGEVITVFAAMLLWHKTPLLSMQLLWINLVTDSLPAITLGMEAVEKDVMDRKPKPKDEGIFAHGLGIRVVLQGFMFAILTLIGFVVGENVTGSLAGGQTLAFMILALSQVVQAFNMRSEHSLFKIGPFSNHKLNWAALASLAMVCLVLSIPVGIAFGLVTLPWELYLLGLGLILVPLVVMEISKAIGLIKHHH